MGSKPLENAKLTQMNIKSISERLSEHLSNRVKEEGKRAPKLVESSMVARKKRN